MESESVQMAKKRFCFLFLIFVFLLPTCTFSYAGVPGSSLGGGELEPCSYDHATNLLRAQTLNNAHVSYTRIVGEADRYWVNNAPVPSCLDDSMLLAYQYNLTPTILLNWQGDSDGTNAGSYQKWYSIGSAFAERFKPGGSFCKQYGITGTWGVRVFKAINEPDNPGMDGGNEITKTSYYNAMNGWGDGVHSADSSLKAMPGGFCMQNAALDYSLDGYGTTLAPLWNDGTLDGIVLHTYYDDVYAPMQGTYSYSCQDNFDSIKEYCGITADILLSVDELNVARDNVAGSTDTQKENNSAKELLTGIWDACGVVKNDGFTLAGIDAQIWYFMLPNSQYTDYGVLNSLNPYTPRARANTATLAADLTSGMSFETADPKGKGEYTLKGTGKKMWVWQDRQYWTNHYGTSYTCTGIPAGSTTLKVYGWDGLRQTIALSGQTSYTVSSLPGNETYMFLATGGTVTPTPTSTPAPTPTPTPAPTTLIHREAESYSAQSNTLMEPTSDTGGGLLMGFNTSSTGYADYSSISIPTAGTYTFRARVAGVASGQKLQFKKGSTVLCTVTVPNTGGYDSGWTTVSASVTLSAGTQTFRILGSANATCYNVNWWELER